MQAAGARQLVGRGIVGDALDRQHADEKIGDGQKAQPDAGRFGPIRFGLNICEAPGGKKRLHGIVQVVAGERLADFERRSRHQRRRFFRRNAGQLDLINRQSQIGRDGSEVRSGLRG